MADSKKYDGSQWQHSLRKLTTATEAVENPLYSDGTAITEYTLKGNTVQNGTPTPSKPVDVQGVGTLDSGQYKIPISNGGVTTNIYLGSTQTVRQVKKLVLTGDEEWNFSTVGKNHFFYTYISDCAPIYTAIPSTHYTPSNESGAQRPDNSIRQVASGTRAAINIRDEACSTIPVFKAYLAQQYANGTPVTVWYVLDTAETAAVNEPLMKIGDYADTLSNAASIPTTEGANSITVDTTVQPSEFMATWTGWHDSSVKEYDGSDWN